MGSPWRQVERLAGSTIPTTSGRARFEVRRVDDRSVTVAPTSSGVERTIERHKVEAAYQLHLAGEEVSPSRLRAAGITEWHPAYIAGIVKAITSAGR
jgi:hypothetical protein